MRRYLDCPGAFCRHIPCALGGHTSWLGDELIAVEQAEPSLSRSPHWAPRSHVLLGRLDEHLGSLCTGNVAAQGTRPVDTNTPTSTPPPCAKTNLSVEATVEATVGRGETNIGGKGRWS
jgi:hypothetical protein